MCATTASSPARRRRRRCSTTRATAGASIPKRTLPAGAGSCRPTPMAGLATSTRTVASPRRSSGQLLGPRPPQGVRARRHRDCRHQDGARREAQAGLSAGLGGAAAHRRHLRHRAGAHRSVGRRSHGRPVRLAARCGSSPRSTCAIPGGCSTSPPPAPHGSMPSRASSQPSPGSNAACSVQSSIFRPPSTDTSPNTIKTPTPSASSPPSAEGTKR